MRTFAPTGRPTDTAAKLAVVFAAVAFGTTGAAHVLGPAGTTPIGVGTMRILVGAAALLGVVIATRRLRPPAPVTRKLVEPATGPWWQRRGALIIIGGAGVALYQPMFLTGIERSGVALGTIVALAFSPALVGLWEAVVQRRRPSTVWMHATTIAVFGACVLVLGQQHGDSKFDAIGLGCSLLAEVGYAVYALSAKALVERSMDSTVAMTWLFGAGAVILAPSLLHEPLGWLASWRGILLVAYLGVVCTAVAYVLYGYGLRSLSTSTAVSLSMADPLTAAFVGMAILGERLQPIGWVGAALVLAGLSMFGRRPTVRPSRQRMPIPAV